jgi:hypothetical protein
MKGENGFEEKRMAGNERGIDRCRVHTNGFYSDTHSPFDLFPQNCGGVTANGH